MQCRSHTDSACIVIRRAAVAAAARHHEHRLTVYRDMPPQGGFDAIKYKRNLPFRGPGGVAILGGVTAICAYGFYRVGQGNLEKR